MRAYLSELIGTAILVMVGCSALIFVGQGALIAAFAFGVALILVVYIMGNISGAHVNPAVTIVLALSKKFPWNKVFGYIVSQIVGATFGAAILYAIVANITGGTKIIASGFATNFLNPGANYIAGGIMEILMTMIFCLVILATTRVNWHAVSTPVATGLAFFMANLVAFPLTGASINPARSIGPALVSGQNMDSLGLFIIAPLVGAILAYFIDHYVLSPKYNHHHHKNI